MSAPVIWIGIPLVFSLGVILMRVRQPLANYLVMGLSAALSFIALVVPISTVVSFGLFSIEISSTLDFFGRKFVLDAGDGYLLFLVYSLALFWFVGGFIIETNPNFIPLGLGIISLFVAAIAVEPFLYAALLIEMAVLLSIPIFVSPGRILGQGVLRYLIFQTLALPFILLAGWAMARVEVNPANIEFLHQAILLLGLGFAFWLAIFPFYSWIPLLVEEVSPYVSGFILTIAPSFVLLLMLDFLDAFTWLRDYPYLLQILRYSGVLMVATGGLWAAFQKNIARLFGYGVIIENGFSLLSLSLLNQTGLQIFILSFIPRTLALALWAFALSVINKKYPSDFQSNKGLLRKLPFASLGLIFASLSISGMPLFAAFPNRQILLDFISKDSLFVALWMVLGSIGFLLSSLRILSNFATSDQNTWEIGENRAHIFILSMGGIGLIFMGIFPSWVMPQMLTLLEKYQHLWR